MRKCRRAGMVSVFMMLLGVSLRAQVSVPEELAAYAYPDVIIYNAKIVTMSDASLNDSPGRIVRAMALRGDRIQFLGSDQEVLRYAGPQTRKIDLKGRTVVPGMIDAHNHLHNSATNAWAEKNSEKLETVARRFEVAGKTFADLTKGIELVIKEQMGNAPPGQWAMISMPTGISGTDAIASEYMVKKGMTEDQLGALAPTRPVVVTVHGGGWITNKAGRLDLANMYAMTPTEENLMSFKEDTMHQSTFNRAIFVEKYFDRHMDELADVLEEYLTHTAAGGFTTYSSHLSGLKYLPAFQKLMREERMPIRFGFAHRYCQEFYGDLAGCYLRLGDMTGMGYPHMWMVGMTLGAVDLAPPRFCTTAEPRPGYETKIMEMCYVKRGSPFYEAIYTMLRSRYRYVVNHEYADEPLDDIMDIMENVMEENPDITLEDMRALRLSADHCGLYPRPDQLPRMQRLGIIISCSAGSINRSTPWLKALGEDKADWISPIKNILNAGVMPVMEGEGGGLTGDSPVTPMARMMGFIDRKNAKGQPIGPRQAVDRVSVMKMATIWGSFFVLKEKELGSLEPGKLADFIVFNKDYFTVPEQEIPTVYPVMTVLGGKTIVLQQELARDLGVPAVGPQKKWVFTIPERELGDLDGGGD